MEENITDTNKDTNSQLSKTGKYQPRFPSTSSARLALGGFTGVIVVLLIFLILTAYLIYYIGTTNDSGAAFVIWLVIIPGFVISAVVAVIPGALGGLLGGHIATWVEDRYQRPIDPRIGPILGGILGVLMPIVCVIWLIQSSY